MNMFSKLVSMYGLVIILFAGIFYALKETINDMLSNLIYGIITRGEQISEGVWVEMDEYDISGIVIGQNITNTKIDTGNGKEHILNRKVYKTNLRVIYSDKEILERMKNKDPDRWINEKPEEY